jgi:hypothetical protein
MSPNAATGIPTQPTIITIAVTIRFFIVYLPLILISRKEIHRFSGERKVTEESYLIELLYLTEIEMASI